MKTIIKLFFLAAILLSSSDSFPYLNGTYTIGSGGNFPTISAAVTAAVDQWITGPVIFNIKPGIYIEEITVPSINGVSSVNTITFRSQTGDPNDVTINGISSVFILNGARYITFQNLKIGSSTNYSFRFINLGHFVKIQNNIFNVGSRPIVVTEFRYLPTNIVISGNQNVPGFYIDDLDFGFSKKVTITGNSFTGKLSVQGMDSVLIDGNSTKGIDCFLCNFITVTKNKNENMFSIRDCTKGNVYNNFGFGSTYPNFSVSGSDINVIYNTLFYTGAFGCDVGGNNILTLNNIFIKLPSRFAIYNSGVFSNYDYNNMFNGGNDSLVRYNGTSYNNMTDLYNATGTNQHSSSKEVHFVSPSDLHLTGASIGDNELAGIPTSLVTDDIDGNPRNPVHPYKGADEADFPLPVELSSFTANVDRNKVTLNWVTVSEINNSGFEIERSTVSQGIPNVWDRVGSVAGYGTTFTPQYYSFTDQRLNTGKYNYRLKQIDLNGNYEYYNLSNEVEIGIKVIYKVSQNYPNPFNPTTKIDYELQDDGMVNIKLYDLSGKEVRTIVNAERTAGYYTLEFNAEGLSSGVYIYRMEIDGILKDTKQMILLK